MHHASATGAPSPRTAPAGRSIIQHGLDAGLQGQASQSNYGAAKAGLAAMTIIASLEPDALRRSRQLHRARWLHAHGRPGSLGHHDQEPEEYTEFDGMNPGTRRRRWRGCV